MKRTLSSIAAAALVLGTLAPAAFADTAGTYSDVTTGGYGSAAINDLTAKSFIHGFSDGTYKPGYIVSRGQLLAYMMNALGLKAQANAQYYADVAPGNWAFNYVGAAQENGWINPYWIGVKPGYNFNENNQASMGDAASFFVAAMENAGKISKTDLNGMSPLAYAKSIGLFNGVDAAKNTLATYTGGTDTVAQQSVYLDRASAAIVLENIVAWNNGQLLPAGATVTVSPSSTLLGPNSVETLSAVVKNADGSTYTLPSTAAVSFSVDNANGFVNQAAGSQTATLVVTKAGTYNVTATVDGISSTPVAINTYGELSGFGMKAAQASLVANGQSTDTITVSALDANGNTDGSFTGSASLTFSGSGASVITPGATGQASDIATVTGNSNAYTLNFVNGQATFAVQAGQTPGLTSTYALSYTPSGSTTAMTSQLSLATVQQVATSLSVASANGSKYVSANQATPYTFNVQVLDQQGQPMLTGTYSYTIAVTGSGTYTGATTGVYFGTLNPTSSAITVSSEQGVQGAINVAVSGQGLADGSGSVQAVIAQAPVKFSATTTASTANLQEGAANSLVYNLTPVDGNGYPATFPSGTFPASTFSAYVTNSTGANATNISVNNVVIPSTGGLSLASGVVSLTDSTGAADAGSYTLTIKDANGNVWATVPFTVGAGNASKFTLTGAAQYVTESSPSTTFTAQLQDSNGNNSALAGVPVVFTVAGNASGSGSFAGSTTGSVTVYTNANGVATATLNMQPYAGEAFTVSATATNAGTTLTAPSAQTVTVEPMVASQAQVSIVNGSGSSIVTAGQTVTGTVYLKDEYGNPTPLNEPQTVSLTPTGGITITSIQQSGTVQMIPSSASAPYSFIAQGGYFTFTGTATTEGAASVAVSDTSISPNVSATGTVTVLPSNTMAGYAFFNSQGQEINSNNMLAVSANTPVEVFLRPVDGENNPLNAAPNAAVVNFSDEMTGSFAGQFRVGSNLAAAQTQVVEGVGTTEIPVWYVNATAGSYNLNASAAVVTQISSTTGTQDSVVKSVYDYTGSVVVPAGFTFVASNVTVTGATYSSASPSAGTFNVVAGTPSADGSTTYWVKYYSTNATLSSAPTISYN